jgi:hypothetical protein
MRTPVGYMIRRKSDGLFSGGGYGPRFNTVGKVWRNANTFHNHLAMFRETTVTNWDGNKREIKRNPQGIWFLPKQYEGCEVVEVRFEVLKSTDLKEYCQDLKPGSENL